MAIQSAGGTGTTNELAKTDRAAAGDGHDSIFHVGLADQPKRHIGSAPEIDLRSKLRGSDADPVLFFLGVFRVRISLRQVN